MELTFAVDEVHTSRITENMTFSAAAAAIITSRKRRGQCGGCRGKLVGVASGCRLAVANEECSISR